MGTHSGRPGLRPSLADRIEATGSEDIPGVGASVVLALAAFGAALGALVGLFLDGAASTAAAGAGVGSLAGLGVVLGWLAFVAARSRWVRRPGRGARRGAGGGAGGTTSGARRRRRSTSGGALQLDYSRGKRDVSAVRRGPSWEGVSPGGRPDSQPRKRSSSSMSAAVIGLRR